MKTIEYKVSFEKMISRLPGLFAYLDSDDFGEVSLHKATDSIDGCWGKIVENIKLPSDVALTIKKTHVITFEDVTNEYIWLDSSEQKHVAQETDIDNEIEEYYFFLKGGEVYSFRTIIDYYYQYKDELEEENGFRQFVEEAIGKIVVPDSVKGAATPKYVYLSNVKNLYNQLVKMDKQCEFYNHNLDEGLTDKDEHLCCLCKKYNDLGGDAFKKYVGDLISEAEKIANKYFNYAKAAESDKYVTYVIEDENLETCPPQYNIKTIKITQEEYDQLSEQEKKKYIANDDSLNLEFFVDLVSTYQDFGIMSIYAPQWIPCKRYYVGDKVMFDGELYICVKENTGKWDEDLLTVVFAEINENNQRIWVKYSDFNTLVDYMDDDAIDKYNKERIVAFDKCGYIRPRSISQSNLPFMIESTTNSKLPDLHRFVTYYNDDGVAERPSEGFDWLFYYRVGTILNIRTMNDDLGNILSYSHPQDENGNKKAATIQTDLMAYGDFIQNIEVNPEEHKIKFIYRVGVHLKSTAAPIQTTDDDGNKLYNWKKFVWDENDKIGIKYEEEYNYEEEGDLDKLIKGEFTIQMENGIQSFSFNEYINGKYDKMLTTYKFEFITINNSFNYDKTIAHQNVNIVSTLTDLQIYRKDYDEFFNSPLIREEYLNGITYKPTKDIDVHIERGSTSVFEKHIAFSEVKNLDSMIDYKNGSFFILTEG